jgi:YjbE family integral membrane protein
LESLIAEVPALLSVMFINIVLSGDNAVVVGMAAAGLPREQRSQAIMWGMVAATVLRLVFSVIAVYLLAVPGLKLVGGLLLVWIAWGMWKELREGDEDEAEEAGEAADGAAPHHHDKHGKTLGMAMRQIIIADVSMSLDNVLAVAGAAAGHTTVMFIGLATSIAFMGLAAAAIARLLDRYKWIAYIGLALIVYVAVEMLWEGGHEVLALLH